MERDRAGQLSGRVAEAIARCERTLADSRALAEQYDALRCAVEDTLGDLRRRRERGRAGPPPPTVGNKTSGDQNGSGQGYSSQ